MDKPSQSPYNVYDVVAIQNIDDEPFTFEYDRARGNAPHTIPAGEVRRFPRFLAQHAVKHLIDKLITKMNRNTNDLNLRQSLASQIVINEETFASEPVKTDAEKIKEAVDNLNKPSELDMILSKRRAEAEARPKVEEKPEEPKMVEEEKFAGLETKPKPAEPEEEPVKPMPTRAEIIAYARKQGMTIDAEQEKKFVNWKIEKMLKELGDPRDQIL